jgi:putative membrane protein
LIQNKLYITPNKKPGFRHIGTLIFVILTAILYMNGVYTLLLLLLSNVFMTLAWYGHLKLQQTGISSHWSLIGVIVFSWGIAFFEYCCQVPANRIGFDGNGGPFSLVQLKVIQECVSLVVFAVIANLLFHGQSLHWNHIAAFACLVAAVYFVFMK